MDFAHPVEGSREPLQDQAAPDGICFGCGSAHPRGLRIKSHWDADGIHVIARHRPADDFTGWPGLVYGGLLAMVVDCHSNWTAMAYHYRAEQRAASSPPRIECVTAQLNLTYRRPTPMGTELLLRARLEGELGRKSRVLCEVWADDVLTVTADSTFVRLNAEQLSSMAHGAK